MSGMFIQKKIHVINLSDFVSKGYMPVLPVGQTLPELEAPILCDPREDKTDTTLRYPAVSAHVCRIISHVFF